MTLVRNYDETIPRWLWRCKWELAFYGLGGFFMTLATILLIQTANRTASLFNYLEAHAEVAKLRYERGQAEIEAIHRMLEQRRMELDILEGKVKP